MLHYALVSGGLYSLDVGHIHKRGNQLALFHSLGVDDTLNLDLVLTLAFDLNLGSVLEDSEVAFHGVHQAEGLTSRVLHG